LIAKGLSGRNDVAAANADLYGDGGDDDEDNDD
jgi:hypothetical protein